MSKPNRADGDDSGPDVLTARADPCFAAYVVKVFVGVSKFVA